MYTGLDTIYKGTLKSAKQGLDKLVVVTVHDS